MAAELDDQTTETSGPPDVRAALTDYLTRRQDLWQEYHQRVTDALTEYRKTVFDLTNTPVEVEAPSKDAPLAQQFKALRAGRLQAFENNFDAGLKLQAAERKYTDSCNVSWWDFVDQVASAWREYWRIIAELITGGGVIEGDQPNNPWWGSDPSWRG